MTEPDDDYEWPPAPYAWREVATASVFILVVVGLLVWAVWKLIDWAL